MKPLNESEVNLFKRVSKGEKGPVFEETDFDISLKTLTEDEIKEYMDEHKDRKDDKDERDDEKDRDDDRRPRPKPHPRPHPHPKFKYAIVGKVSVAGVSCDDQGPYLVKYGSRKDDDKDEKDDEDDGKGDLDDRKDDDRRPRPRPHPRPPPGAFFVAVKRCKRPEPRDD